MGSVEVGLDNPGNVYLLSEKNYVHYCNDDDFEYYGGQVKNSPFWMRAPWEGEWHLVIDSEGAGEPVNVAVRITDGHELFDEPVRKKSNRDMEENKKKAAGKKEPEAKKIPRKKLLKELQEKLDKIDEEGLLFLLKQAQVLLHNQEVDKINQMAVEQSVKSEKSAKGKTVKRKAGSAPQNSLVDVEEQNGGKSYIITVNGARKILSRQEMQIVLAMCRERISEREFSDRFYRWLKTRRNDILFDGRIGNPSSPLLLLMRKVLKSRVKM